MSTHVVAILPISSNSTTSTITATRVPSTTGLAVIDGTTISVRASGISLPNGDIVSLGYAGIYNAQTTGLFQTITGTQQPSEVTGLRPTPVPVPSGILSQISGGLSRSSVASSTIVVTASTNSTIAASSTAVTSSLSSARSSSTGSSSTGSSSTGSSSMTASAAPPASTTSTGGAAMFNPSSALAGLGVVAVFMAMCM